MLLKSHILIHVHHLLYLLCLPSPHQRPSDVYPQCNVPLAYRVVSSLQTESPLCLKPEASIPLLRPQIKT